MNLHMGHGHVDVGGEDCDEKQGKSPSGHELNPAHGNQQSNAAEQFEDATDLNAGQGERNPRRHRRKKERRVAQMDRPGKEKESGEKQTNEGAEKQGKRR